MTAVLASKLPLLDATGEKCVVGTGAARLDSVDLVRGIVMVLMALDHVRDYCNASFARFDPMDLTKTTPEHYLTRWVTHFCAPTFVFLAGTGAFLAGSRGKTTGQLAWFLLTRGLWLALLEVTLVHVSWTFNLDLHERGGAVIWAIGWSMVGLAGLVWLPTSAVAALGVAIMAFHNLFDSVTVESLGRFGWIWALLHQPSGIGIWFDSWWHWSWANLTPTSSFATRPDLSFATPYPILPWLGVMAAGYGLGAMLLLDRPERRRQLVGLGMMLILAFAALRLAAFYGDPRPYAEPPDRAMTAFGKVELNEDQAKPVLQAMAFLDCTKYPPSLLFALMTLGPAILALGLFDRQIGWLGKPLVVFGRVPLFYYLLHLPLIHGVAVAIDYYRFGWSPLAHATFWGLKPEELPPDYGLNLPMTFAVWAGVVLFLYPLCYAYSRIKARYRRRVLSYL
jgi:uncharacterized membrane protein